jgi:uncharacterized protein YkwD
MTTTDTSALVKNETHVFFDTLRMDDDMISPSILESDCVDSRGVDEINKLRNENNKLICLQGVSDQARDWNMHMCNTLGKLAHGDVKQRCIAGMTLYTVPWETCVENVLYNYDSGATGIRTGIRQWNQSPTHAASMTNEEFIYSGYDSYACPDGRIYTSSICQVKVGIST